MSHAPVIAVTTPTGNVGRRVTRLLVQSGVRPRLLLRDAGRLDQALRPLVDVVELDQTDADAVVAATEGVDTLFWVDPPTQDPDPLAAYARAGESVAAAVTAHAIPRVVFQSSIGAEERHGLGEIDGLADTEERLDATGASVVHLRCGWFFTNLLLDPGLLETGDLATAVPVDVPLPWVDPRDIGEVAAGWLLSPGWTGRHVQAVHGPEDLSFVDAAAVLTEAVGRPFRAVQLSVEQVHESLVELGMTERQADAIAGMSRSVRRGHAPALPRGVVTTTPTRLGAWAWEHLRPAVMSR